MPSHTEWAYLAGLIDGEGCITSRKNAKGSHYTRLNVSQSKPELLYWIQERFGGAVSTKSKVWHCGSNHSAVVLMGVLPYLTIKRPQALVALELCNRGEKGNRIPRERQAALARKLKELKR